MKYMAELLVEWMVQHKIIEECKKELYTYGFWQGSLFLFDLLTVGVVGLITDMLWQSFIFMICYGTLRTVAGGYHARSKSGCYFLSVMFLFVVLNVLRQKIWGITLCVVILVFSGIVIYLLAPVEDENKPLDELEKKVYKGRSRRVYFIMTIIVCVILVGGNIEIASCITISTMAVSIMLILGKLKLMSLI